jgi:hypothetical protein
VGPAHEESRLFGFSLLTIGPHTLSFITQNITLQQHDIFVVVVAVVVVAAVVEREVNTEHREE